MKPRSEASQLSGPTPHLDLAGAGTDGLQQAARDIVDEIWNRSGCELNWSDGMRNLFADLIVAAVQDGRLELRQKPV
jgi:hypothetical protein